MDKFKVNDIIIYVGAFMPLYLRKKGTITDCDYSKGYYRVRFENGFTVWCRPESLKIKEAKLPYPNLF